MIYLNYRTAKYNPAGLKLAGVVSIQDGISKVHSNIDEMWMGEETERLPTVATGRRK